MNNFENYCKLCINQVVAAAFTPEKQNGVTVSDYITATTSTTEEGNFSISLEVDKETPTGDYELTVQTGFMRQGEDSGDATSVVSEKILLKVELETVRFEEELSEKFSIINTKIEPVLLPTIIKGVYPLKSVSFAITPADLEDYFSFEVTDWDAGSADPQIESKMFYDGGDL